MPTRLTDDHDPDPSATKDALAELLPRQRCPLCGRVPVEATAALCGHVYCRLCLADLLVSAQLASGTATCKITICQQELEDSAPPIETSPRAGARRPPAFYHNVTPGRADLNQDAAAGTDHAEPTRAIGLSATEVMVTVGSPALPGAPVSAELQRLLDDYTLPSIKAPQHDFSFEQLDWSEPLQDYNQQIRDLTATQDLTYNSSDLQAPQDGRQSPHFDYDVWQTDDLFAGFDQQYAIPAFDDPLPQMNDGLPDFDMSTYDLSKFPEMGFADFDYDFSAPMDNQLLSDAQEPSAEPYASAVVTASSNFPILPTAPSSEMQSLGNHMPSASPLSSTLPYVTSSLPQTPSALLFTPSLSPPIGPPRDISILAGQRFVFKGTLPNQASMESTVRNLGGVVTGGAYKHTTHGVTGKDFKAPPTWRHLMVMDEDGFWEFVREKTEGRQQGTGRVDAFAGPSGLERRNEDEGLVDEVVRREVARQTGTLGKRRADFDDQGSAKRRDVG